MNDAKQGKVYDPWHGFHGPAPEVLNVNGVVYRREPVPKTIETMESLDDRIARLQDERDEAVADARLSRELVKAVESERDDAVNAKISLMRSLDAWRETFGERE